MRRRQDETLDILADDADTLDKIADWCWITSVVVSSVSVTDVRRLWTVILLSPLGRAFPSMVGSLYSILFQRIYRGTTLAVDYGVGLPPGDPRSGEWLSNRAIGQSGAQLPGSCLVARFHEAPGTLPELSKPSLPPRREKFKALRLMPPTPTKQRS